MSLFLIGLIFVLNFAISWWNAYAVGKAWAEAKAHHQSGGGVWPRIMCWAGAIQSASGFTWCYMLLLALGAYALNLLTAYHVGIALQLGYIIIVPGVLLSGLVITVDSWARAYREGGVLNYGVAAYNTYAQVHNTVSAIQNYGSAFGNVLDAFAGSKGSGSSKSDKDGAAAVLIIIIVILAIAGGIITTTMIIKKAAGSDRLRTKQELEAARAGDR